jgi:energy-converting hydrogenase A subunit M
MNTHQDSLKVMKTRIIRSFKWREDVVIPLSKELEIPVNEFEEILINNLDMSSLESLYATFEYAKPESSMEKLNCDLSLYWLVDVLKIINTEDYNKLKSKLMVKIAKGEKYKEVLKFGKKEVYQLLKK